MRVILASQSPRRKELLSLFGFPFDVVPSMADESGVTGSGAERVSILARKKAAEVASRFPDALVIGSDTLVCSGSEVLGKPADAEDAARMLRLLSGSWHEVHTGVCLIGGGKTLVKTETSRVHFQPMTSKEIDWYIATGEPFDKAGAYAIQGIAGIFIDRIEGSHSNIIGLPLSLVRECLNEFGFSL